MSMWLLFNSDWEVLSSREGIRILRLAFQLACHLGNLVDEITLEFIDRNLAIFRSSVGVALQRFQQQVSKQTMAQFGKLSGKLVAACRCHDVYAGASRKLCDSFLFGCSACG